ncbi:uncharacterized protein [Anabrus simplex]|uniref:uncharacterized protein n=1 Tax=Anabrus simplex TaxID=316456 RepID=UPI0035A282A4
MACRSILLLIGALFLLQVTSNDVDQVADTQFQRVSNFLEKTILVLDEAATNVTIHMEEMAQEQQQRIDRISENISSKIDEVVISLQERAQQTGVDVGECFKRIPESTRDIAVNLTQGAVGCVVDQVEKAKAIVISLLNLVKDVNTTLLEGKTEWEGCKSLTPSWMVALCEGQVTAKLGIKGAQYAVEATRLITETITLLSSARQNVQTCVSSKLAALPLQIMGAIKELVDCIMGAIKAN